MDLSALLPVVDQAVGLDRLRRRQAPGPCLALAFGPGLEAEVLLLR